MRQTLQVNQPSVDAHLVYHPVAMAGRYEVRQQLADLQQQMLKINGRMIENDLVITLGEVLFEKNKATLKRGASSHLQKIIHFIGLYPNSKITIKGYTDNTSSSILNLELSGNRAAAIKFRLVKEGVPSGRLTSIGYGEKYPVAGNGSSSGRQLNQRVEVIISDVSIKNS